MRKLIMLWVLLCFVYALQAQNTEKDSLKNLLATAKEDANRVLILEGLSYAYLSAYPDTALQYALEGLQLAQKIKDRRGEAYCTNALGNVYFSIGDYPQALGMYLQSLKMKERLNDPQAVAVTYANIGNVYAEQEDYRHALSYIFKTKQVDEKIKDSAGLLIDLYNIGSIYFKMKKIDSALYYEQQAYQIAQRLQDKNIIGAIMNTFGDIQAYLKNFPLARKYYHLSISSAQFVKDHEVLSANYYGLADVFKQTGLLDSSIFYARKALSVAQGASFQKQVLSASIFLSELFKTKKQFDSAFQYQELGMATKDSLFNAEKIKKVQNLKFLEHQRQQSIEAARLEYRNKVKLYVVFFALGVFLLIALLLWRNNVQKQRAFILLQQQKDETDKQKAKVEQTLEELKATQAQLVQREKMASLGELTAGIAHEIQNPLNFINNFSEVSAEQVEEMETAALKGQIEDVTAISADLKNNLQKVVVHGRRADAIVKGMLEHSRSTRGEKQPTNLNALVEEYLRLSYHGMRAKDKSFTARVQTELDPKMGKVGVMAQDIGRVLVNLFNNAFYAVQERKRQLSGGSYEPTVWVSTRRGEGTAEICVRDNGTGIAQKVLEKIYQPFFTTKPTGEGTGLGLSLSYDIITKGHGGEIKVKTEEGTYTEFVVQLPA